VAAVVAALTAEAVVEADHIAVVAAEGTPADTAKQQF
jgi:hypothetical protein